MSSRGLIRAALALALGAMVLAPGASAAMEIPRSRRPCPQRPRRGVCDRDRAVAAERVGDLRRRPQHAPRARDRSTDVLHPPVGRRVAGGQRLGPGARDLPRRRRSASVPNLAAATATPLAWSRDLRYLAVSLQSSSLTKASYGSGLVVIDLGLHTLTRIARGEIYGASFAPNGSDELVYARARSQLLTAPVNLYMSKPNGSDQRAFTHDGRSLNPVWGQRGIAYDRERLRSGYAPEYQIWLRSPSGWAFAGSRTYPWTRSSPASSRSRSPRTARGCWRSSWGRTRAKPGRWSCRPVAPGA